MVSAIYPSSIDNINTTDTVIIGHGPSALFLSYLLHGHVPYYNPNPAAHPDTVLHKKLLKALSDDSGNNVKSLYQAIQTPEAYNALTSHFEAAWAMSYPLHALPLNALIDTLLRPMADIAISPEETTTRVRWSWQPEHSVDHIVLGQEDRSGGQWAGKEVWSGEQDGKNNGGINEDKSGMQTLSYAEMLSLPGYSIHDHYRRSHNGEELAPDARPTRRLVSEYYSTYPAAVGISDSVFKRATVLNVERTTASSSSSDAATNFLVTISERNIIKTISCRNVVLASGIFSTPIAPPLVFDPLTTQPSPSPFSSNNDEKLPLLVVGSGYTAADIILCHGKDRPIVHIYKWQPDVKASPLKGCHPQVYPMYARVYKWMRETALGRGSPAPAEYEGFPNGEVIETSADGRIKIQVTSPDGAKSIVERKVWGVRAAIGRKGRIDYLSRQLRSELKIAPQNEAAVSSKITERRPPQKEVWVRSNSLRNQVENDFEVAPNVFAIGSLTGDTLVRFMGGSVYAAGKILDRAEKLASESTAPHMECATSLTSGDERTHNGSEDCFMTDDAYPHNGHFEAQPLDSSNFLQGNELWWPSSSSSQSQHICKPL